MSFLVMPPVIPGWSPTLPSPKAKRRVQIKILEQLRRNDDQGEGPGSRLGVRPTQISPRCFPRGRIAVVRRPSLDAAQRLLKAVMASSRSQKDQQSRLQLARQGREGRSRRSLDNRPQKQGRLLRMGVAPFLEHKQGDEGHLLPYRIEATLPATHGSEGPRRLSRLPRASHSHWRARQCWREVCSRPPRPP